MNRNRTPWSLFSLRICQCSLVRSQRNYIFNTTSEGGKWSFFLPIGNCHSAWYGRIFGQSASCNLLWHSQFFFAYREIRKCHICWNNFCLQAFFVFHIWRKKIALSSFCLCLKVLMLADYLLSHNCFCLDHHLLILFPIGRSALADLKASRWLSLHQYVDLAVILGHL